jgi:hypothetical protein
MGQALANTSQNELPLNLKNSGTSVINYPSLPHAGHVDSFHTIQNKEDLNHLRLEQAMHGFRFLKTIDLLRSRKAFKELLGSRNSVQRKHVNYDVPEEVKNIFLASDGVKILPIEVLVKQIEETKYELPQLDREDVIKTLTILSTVLAAIDHSLKYYAETIWEHPAIKETVAKYNLEMNMIFIRMGKDIYIPANSHHGLRRAKIEWKAKWNSEESTVRYDDKVSELLGQKSWILNQYPILGILHKSSPIYKHFYRGLKNLHKAANLPVVGTILNGGNVRLGISKYRYLKNIQTQEKTFQSSIERRGLNFPDQEEYQAVNFPVNQFELSAPKYFQEKLQKVWEHYKNDKSWFNKYLSKQNIAKYFDEALLIALKANTDFLKDLNSTREYAENPVPFYKIAEQDAVWERLKINFQIQDQVLEDTKSEFIRVVQKIKDKKEFINTIITSAGVVLLAAGVVALAFTTGGLGMGLIFASTPFFPIAAQRKYSLSKRYEEVSTNLYYSSKNSADYFQTRNAIKISQSDASHFQLAVLLSAFVCLKPLGKAIEVGVTYSSKGIMKAVKITAAGVSKIKSVATNITQSILAETKLGQNLMSRISNMKPVVVSAPEVASTTSQFAEKTKVIVEKFKTKFMDDYMERGPLRQGVKKNILKKMGVYTRELTVELAALLYSEIKIRGDKFDEEIGYVIMNAIYSVLLISVVVYRASATTYRIWDDIDAKNYARAFKGFAVEGAKMGVTAGVVSIPVTFGWEFIRYFSEFGDTDKEFSDYMMNAFNITLLYAVFLGVSSPIRSQMVYMRWNRESQKRYLTEFKALYGTKFSRKYGKVLAEFELVPLSFVNNMIGTGGGAWLSRVLGMTKIEDEAPEDLPEESYMFLEGNTNNYYYLFPELNPLAVNF